MNKNKILTIGGAMVIIAVVLLTAFFGNPGGETKNQPSKPTHVRAVPASIEPITEILELTGSVEPQRVARLTSPAEGPVVSLRVREGDRVEAGEIILSIGRREGIDAQIASYRESVKKEEDNLNRIKPLVESQALPEEELDKARAAYENAKAQLVKATEAARDYLMVAPWNGIVSRVNVREGDYVSPRTPQAEIYDPVGLVVRAAVPERYAAQVHKGLGFQVRLDAFPDSVFSARIVRTYPFLEEQMRTRTVEAEISTPAALLPGMFARLKLPLKTVDTAVVVPSQSVLVLPSGQKVIFVVSSDTVSQRIVELGIEQGNRVQVLTGVAAGELVVVAGNEKLKSGAKVRLINSDSASKNPGVGQE